MDKSLMNRPDRNVVYELIVVGAILVSLGFPGTWSDVIGESLSMAIGYAAFILEILVMLLSSGRNFMDLKIVDLKFAYSAIYLMLAVFFVDSMVVSSNKSDELISVIRFSTTALFALWIVEHFEVDRMIELTLYAQVLFVLASLTLLAVHPSSCFSFENGARSFTGLFTTKNPMGAELSFGIMMQAALYRIRRDRGERMPRFSLAFFVLQCIMQLTCRALGSLFCVVIPLGYVLFLEKRAKRRLPLGWIYTGVTIGFMVFAMNFLPLFEPFLALFGKDATLTGRTPMWAQFIHVMENHHTFLGFGFSMFWRDPEAVRLFHEGFSRGSWGNTMTYGAHNTLLELWLDNGLIGLAVFFLMIILCFRRIDEMEEDAYIFCCLYILQVMLKGLTERSFTTYNYQSLYLFISLGLACTARRNPEKETGDKERGAEGDPRVEEKRLLRKKSAGVTTGIGEKTVR